MEQQLIADGNQSMRGPLDFAHNRWQALMERLTCLRETRFLTSHEREDGCGEVQMRSLLLRQTEKFGFEGCSKLGTILLVLAECRNSFHHQPKQSA